MSTNNTILTLVLISALTYLAGCGKNESPSPQPITADKPQKPDTTPQPVVAQSQSLSPVNLAATNVAEAVTSKAATTLAGSAPAVQTAVPTQSPEPTRTSAPVTSAPQTAPTLSSLSQDQVVRGLQEALSKGLQQAVAQLGHDGGFLTNINVRIPMPEKLQKIETGLRALKQDKLADDFVATMNHAAEQAVPEAGPVFVDALRNMSIQDAKAILAGPTDAATQYFQRTTQTNLYAKFYPIVQKATRQTGVTAAYQKLMDSANVGNLTQKLGNLGGVLGSSLVDKESLDVDSYVTGKAMDGLFKMIAEQEKQIRQNPVARTTDLLQKVFGALKK